MPAQLLTQCLALGVVLVGIWFIVRPLFGPVEWTARPTHWFHIVVTLPLITS